MCTNGLSVQRKLSQTRLGQMRMLMAFVLMLLCCLLMAVSMRWFRLRPSATPTKIGQQASELGPMLEPLQIEAWRSVEDLPREIAQYKTVFWEPRDTISLRAWLAEKEKWNGLEVLEIGTGTGLLSLCCVQNGAASVVATDINPNAVDNAAYNSRLLGFEDRLQVRRVPENEPQPFSVIAADEKFDLIISNPPWEDEPVTELAAYALFDPGFGLLDGILSDSSRHLRPGGRMLLAYGARTAIERIQTLGPQNGWQVRLLDERNLNDLPEVFLPGMLLELTRND